MLSRRELANAIRALSIDAVQQANSGHPGMPMGMADIAEVLWNNFLKHNPNNPEWPNRDRFVVSNGHGSMLLYSLLHLTGYALSLDELRAFRQLHSKTPGHPEYGLTPGIETTTGPLGQGISNAVGMAIAERALAAQFNQAELEIIDHYTYAFVGDGCLMEGISHEACSLAGTLGLGKLIVCWDDNGISIDGEVDGWFTDNTAERFRAYHWQVIEQVDGHDSAAVEKAIKQAQANTDQPTLICCRTTIGYGSPGAAGKASSHGAPLGEDEVSATRKQLQWPHAAFVIPDDIAQAWNAKDTGAKHEKEWQGLFAQYEKQYPDLAKELQRRWQSELPTTWQDTSKTLLQHVNQEAKSLATRKASQNVLNYVGPHLPELLGGSADLTGSNNTNWQGSKVLTKENPGGNYIHYGVREFGMSAIMNGIALYGGFIPYGGTFLVFSDYARNAIRMAALMQQRVVFVLTHDSVGLGEDGPTHQPIEHAAILRMTPNVSVWRPCDSVETAIAWQAAIENSHGPTCLLLSRQTLAHQSRSDTMLANIKRGGYVLHDSKRKPDVILIATGSEVVLAMQAAERMAHSDYAVRVVSMPSTDVFDSQDAAYRESVLPSHVTKRIAIEAGSKDYWYKYVGLQGKIIGLDRFGESAPAKEVFEYLGLTVDKVVEAAEELLMPKVLS